MYSYCKPGNKAAFIIITAITAAIGLTACGNKSPQSERPQNQQASNSAQADAPVAVTVAKTEARNVPAVI